MPNPEPLDWLPDALDRLEREGLRRVRRVATGLAGEVVDFGANDYLGLAGDPRLAEAARVAASRHGWGAGASPVVSGRSEPHAELEQRLAEFEGVEAAMLFPSGFAAGAGVLPALVGSRDAIYADAKNHACLIDGCRLSHAERRIYPHNDAARLAELLAADAGRFRRRLIVTDGLFSMDGDFAPLAELGRLADEHGAMLLVDEAHATGVWGPSGRGSVEQAATSAPDLPAQVTIRMGTLSKALGAAGGFIAGSRELIDWLSNRARSYVFSTASPPALAAAGLEALRIAQAEPERRERLLASAVSLRDRLASLGWDLAWSESQILPIRIGDPRLAVALSDRLAERGLFVPAIRPPTVPEGESLLRVSLSAQHSADDLDRLVEALGEADQPARPD